MISFVNHSKFLALHQIFEEKTSNIRKRKNEGRKPKKNRKHNEQGPAPSYIIALGHALLSKKNVRELLWLHARLQKYNVIIKIIIYHDAVR